MKYWVFAIGAIFLIGIVTIVAEMVSPAREVVSKTMDGDNIIYNYEWFKQQAEDLDAIERKIAISEAAKKDHIDNLPKDRSKWKTFDKEEYSRLRDIVVGQKLHFEQMKADFKARSKMANRAIFKEDAKIIKWVEKVLGVKK